MAKSKRTKINLSKISTRPPDNYDKDKIKKATKEMAKEIADLHEDMIAEGKRSLLIVFQGMDSSGKDGATKNVFRYCPPLNLSAYSFKKPTKEEMNHDFLWRAHKQTPGKGEIQVFNRSYYEDILIQRVHSWITEAHVKKRMAAINAFEELLTFDNNTTVLKFYMHLSKERQLEKLQERIDDPSKNWKHNPGDWEERKHWDEYRKAYEYAINNSTIPWIIAPVDSRSYRNYFITREVLKVMKKWKMKRPVLEKST